MLRPLLLSFFILGAHLASAQGVGINNPTPDPSALLDLTSGERGLLVPRMTTVQRDGIPVPAVSLLIFNTSNERFEFYNGSAWVPLVAGGGWQTTGNAGTDPAVNFLGTTDNRELVFRTNGLERMRITNTAFGRVGIRTDTPSSTLEVRSTNGATTIGEGLTVRNVASGAAPGQVRISHWRGTSGSPAAILNNDFLGRIDFMGHNGTGEYTGAIIQSRASEDFSTSPIARRTKLQFMTSTNAGAQVLTRMTIDSDGNTGIATEDPQDRLHVVGNIRMVDGNQGAGRVLVSDANGRGTWTDADAMASGNLDDAYDFGGPGMGRTIIADAGAVRVEGVDGFVSTGTLGSGAIPQEGAGVRMMWYPGKAAFRAGSTTTFPTVWNDDQIGENSMAFGSNTRASGARSAAWGELARAAGPHSTAWGLGTNAIGGLATTWGNSAFASGVRSTAWGNFTHAFDPSSTAWGDQCQARGTNSTAWGQGTRTQAANETALGSFNTLYTALGNSTDRLLVVGNGETAGTSSNAFVILKNGNTAIGNITPTTKLDVDGQVRIRGGNPAAGRVLTSAADGTASWQVLGPAQTNAWSLDGNLLTNAHVLGSNNNVSLKFQVNGQTAGAVSNTGLTTFLGYRAGENNTGGSNTFVGYFSGLANTTGANNTFIGVGTGENNIGANDGTFVGRSAGISNQTGANNTYIGRFAGSTNIAGSNNVALGRGAGNAANGYAACTFVGFDADGSNTTSRQNSMALGNISRITADNQVRVGNAGNTSIGGFANWTNLSDGTFKTQVQENVPGLALIMALRPVTYRLDRDQINKVLDVETETPLGLSDVHTGFIAQEVETAARALGYEFNGVDAPKNSDDHYGLRYATFTVPLVKAVQEQQAEIEAQRQQLDVQSGTIARLLAEMEAIRAAMNTNNSAR